MKAGDIVSVFTPDDTHFDITKRALQKSLHCMVTKPVVMKLAEHLELLELSREKNCLVQVEVHKRFDPVYQDA